MGAMQHPQAASCTAAATATAIGEASRAAQGGPRLLALDRQSAGADIDMQTLGRMAVLIKLVAHDCDDDHERADDQIKHVVAGHGRSTILAYISLWDAVGNAKRVAVRRTPLPARRFNWFPRRRELAAQGPRCGNDIAHPLASVVVVFQVAVIGLD